MLAEQWGCQPWEVDGEKANPVTRWMWRQRGIFFVNEQAAALQEKLNQINGPPAGKSVPISGALEALGW